MRSFSTRKMIADGVMIRSPITEIEKLVLVLLFSVPTFKRRFNDIKSSPSLRGFSYF